MWEGGWGGWGRKQPLQPPSAAGDGEAGPGTAIISRILAESFATFQAQKTTFLEGSILYGVGGGSLVQGRLQTKATKAQQQAANPGKRKKHATALFNQRSFQKPAVSLGFWRSSRKKDP